jgi:hypothetical protein
MFSPYEYSTGVLLFCVPLMHIWNPAHKAFSSPWVLRSNIVWYDIYADHRYLDQLSRSQPVEVALRGGSTELAK